MRVMRESVAQAYMRAAEERARQLHELYVIIDPALEAFATAHNLSLANGHSGDPRVITGLHYSSEAGTIHREILVIPSYGNSNSSNDRFKVHGHVWYDEEMGGGGRELKPRSRHAKLIPIGEWEFNSDSAGLERLVGLLSQAGDTVFRRWTRKRISNR